MEYFAVLDVSSFIWNEEDFASNTEKYYDLILKLPDLYDQLLLNKSIVLMRVDLYNEIVQHFPYNTLPIGFGDFERVTFQFLSKIVNMVVYDENDNINISSNPNLLKSHFSEKTNQEIRYLITKIHSDQNPKSVFFTFKYLWGIDGNLTTVETNVDSCEYDTVCSDDKEELIKYFNKYKKFFEHNPKHDNYKAGEYESELSCYNDRLGDATKAQNLLENARQSGKSFYNYDMENKVWVVFRNHEGNKYHGFNQTKREKIPNEIRKEISK